MTSVLDEIIVGVREDLSIRQEKTSIEELKALAEKVPKALDPFPIFDEAGVVADSVPSSEDMECQNKAAVVLRAVAVASSLG